MLSVNIIFTLLLVIATNLLIHQGLKIRITKTKSNNNNNNNNNKNKIIFKILLFFYVFNPRWIIYFISNRKYNPYNNQLV